VVRFAVAWAVASADAGVRPFLAAVLVLGTVLALVNLVPIAPLDGYVLLGHATGTLGLAAASQAYAMLAVPARLGGSRAVEQRAAVARYPRGRRRLYATYAVVGPLTVLSCAAASVLVAAALIPDAAGPWRWAGPLAVAVLVVAGLATTQRGRT
jgi:putative peptide zinc metalloprotease protein